MTDLEISDSKTTTQTALETISSSYGARHGRHSAWYEPGRDFCFYIQAQEACRASRQRLSKLKLSDEEWSALSSGWTPDLVVKSIRRVGDSHQSQTPGSNLGQSVKNFVNGFCELVTQTSGLVEVLLPHSPAYTMTYGLLVIFFEAVIEKKKYQEKIVDFVEELKHKLPLITFYRQVFPTNDMKICVANLYVEILLFLEEAYVYCKSGRLSKLVDAVLQSGDDRLADHTARVVAAAAKLDALKEAGHIAEQSDMKEILSGTGYVVAQIYENMNSLSAALGSSLMILNQKCDLMESRSQVMFSVQADQYVQTLCDILLPNAIDSSEELELVKQQGHRLAPRDHWDTNGVLADLVQWSQHASHLPLWIGGSSGNQDSWVTEFSADFLTALQPQPVTLLSVFCDAPDNEPVTQTILIKKLILQVLLQHSEMVYTNSSVLNPRAFHRANSFQALWAILEFLLNELRNKPTFIVLDRFERCHPQEDTAVYLLPALLGVAQQFSTVKVIITSVLNPPAEAAARMYDLYIDTGRAARHRER